MPKTVKKKEIICKDPYSLQSVSKTGKTPVALAFGDFRNKDIIDLAVLNYDEQSVDLLLGNSNNPYKTEIIYDTRSAPSFVFTGDINGDGLPDIIIANENDGTISVLLDNPDDSFQSTTTYQ
ncbi:unnamed protein product, partial [Rotaria sp. Silwood1]